MGTRVLIGALVCAGSLLLYNIYGNPAPPPKSGPDFKLTLQDGSEVELKDRDLQEVTPGGEPEGSKGEPSRPGG